MASKKNTNKYLIINIATKKS